MSGVLIALLETWFVHKCQYEEYFSDSVNRDNQPIAEYRDPVEIPSCRLQDLTETEIVSFAENGIHDISDKLLVPPDLEIVVGSKISGFLSNGKDITGLADVVIDEGTYEVVSTNMKRSTVNEYQQVYLRSVG